MSVVARTRYGAKHENPVKTFLSLCNRSITIIPMITVKTLPEFDAWLDGLNERTTRLRLSRRLDKAQRGNLGDVKSVGSGVFEMREHFGPGWRMYYVQRGDILVVMLGGGDKSTQAADITKAVNRSALLED
jgi:putative addiction module killer protein